MKRFLIIIFYSTLLTSAFCVSRFPKPEFDSDYKYPVVTTPQDTSEYSLYITLGLLGLAMTLTAYFTLKKRSRKGVVSLLIFSLLYFGFYNNGCICAIGSIQNVAMAVFNSKGILPFPVAMLFLFPLVFALFFGRVFCGAACPLGAIQDVVVIKPQKVPLWLEHCLGMIPYIYLGLAILYAATGSAFIICNYDPFVAFFRMDGTFNMLLLGIVFLTVGIFIARPYCRFLCPYGVLLRWMSFFSKYRVSITPDTCIQCRLCEDACPFNAIRKPFPEKVPENRKTGRTRIGIFLLVLPIMILVTGWGFSMLAPFLSQMDPTVQLAEQVRAEDLHTTETTTLQSSAFHASGKSKHALFVDALTIRKRFRTGGWYLGGFLGLVLVIKLISLSIRENLIDYEPDRMKCLSCARCFEYCPKEHQLVNDNDSSLGSEQ